MGRSAEGVGRVGGAGATGLAEGVRLRKGTAGAASVANKLGPVGDKAPATQTCGR